MLFFLQVKIVFFLATKTQKRERLTKSLGLVQEKAEESLRVLMYQPFRSSA